jgi:hypothetical protein
LLLDSIQPDLLIGGQRCPAAIGTVLMCEPCSFAETGREAAVLMSML